MPLPSRYAKVSMNTLTLNGMPSDFVYQKSLNTVQKRHHARLWKQPQRLGQPASMNLSVDWIG